MGKALLLLDPQGHPRIGYYKTLPGIPSGQYAYASCDAGCTSPGAWTTALLGNGSSTFNYNSADRFFALDPQGNPGMVYIDNTRSGLFYARCTANCASGAGWQEAQISSIYSFLELDLAYDGQARPRFIYEGTDQSGNILIGYGECNGVCNSAASWSSQDLISMGTNSAFRFGLNNQGQPRMAVYTGTLADPTKSEHFVYAFCNANCTTATSWSNYGIGGNPKDGANGLDLAFNAQGSPVVAFYTGGVTGPADGVGVAVCDSGCDSTAPSWRRVQAWLDPAMDTANPIPPAANCTASYWVGTDRVTLALDSGGKLAITADAKHQQQGGTCTTVQTDANGVFLGLLPAL